jgi:hypothetical protein
VDPGCFAKAERFDDPPAVLFPQCTASQGPAVLLGTWAGLDRGAVMLWVQ